MKKIFFIILILATNVIAQTAGNSGLAFLKLGFGARNIAMSDLGVTTANDVTALNYNPALITNLNNTQFSFTHSEWIQDVNCDMLGIGFQLFSLPFVIGINSTNIPDIEVRTNPGDAETTFNVHYIFGSLSTAFNLYKNLDLGLTLKYIYESFFQNKAKGFAGDIGLVYTDVIKNLNAGISLKNIGDMEKLRAERTKLPADLRIGASYSKKVDVINSDIIFLTGLQKYLATDDIHIHFGTEILYQNLIALRLGYATGYESKDFSAGIGILWNSLNFDYAFTPFQYSLGSSHTISLMYSF
ncbi:MAG: PorV/PorQ family protein [Ignavibacteriales bacterium]|nr:PorV/PorQ family protein [Ignavibacteriales bacterium]